MLRDAEEPRTTDHRLPNPFNPEPISTRTLDDLFMADAEEP
ncbi:MAG: hypothetical protein AAF694_27930 [Bacteroidota bacterium]